MPIYEYQCRSCGHEFEAIQKVSEDPLKECPACGDLELNKLVSAAGFRLKGGGWYETDFKSVKDKKKNLVAGGDGGESTTETKPADAAKTETPKPAAASTD